MTSDPTQPGGGSDEPLDRKLREAIDETETAQPRVTPLPVHVAIEGYEMIRELHRGGQGVVYEAVQKSTKRKVAIKILLEGRFASSSARRRFQREITLVAGLKHPNIIAIFDSGETPDGHQFCVMDYVRGRSIRDYVRQNKLHLEDTLKLFSSVCEAAHFANQKGVIHRDLKPSNILVDTEGVPRVLDFGLAKQLAAGEQSLVSMTGQVVGTLPYMSPEQTRGNPDEIDARSDVYSLGVVLYELLTGQHPYPVKGDMLEVAKHITETEPSPPSKVWSSKSGVSRRKSGRFRTGQCPIDDELQTVVLKTLSKERQRRYQSADALRQDISSYLQGDPIEAKRDSSLYLLRKSLRRHRTRIAVMAGFAVVAAVALYVGSRTGGPTESLLAPSGSIRSLAVLPLENLSGDPKQAYFADGMTGELITALGRIGALKVISRMSVMAYKDTNKSPPEIARELKVDALVAGTVTPLGDRVRIAVNLINGDTSEQLWGDSYERDLRDIWAMQSEIALAIANRIGVQVTPQQAQRLTSIPSTDPNAYHAYLRGLDYFGQPGNAEDTLRLAVQMFERAVKLDPDFALAYAQLSRAHSRVHNFGYDTTKARAAKAKAAVDRAFELQTELPEGHLAMGYYHYWCNRKYDLALEALAIAEKDLPNDASILAVVGFIRRRQGRLEEALGYLKRASELRPLAADHANRVAETYIMLRRYSDGLRWCDRSISMAPNQVESYETKALIHWLWHGDIEKARSTLEGMPRKNAADSIFVWFRQELFERKYPTALDRLAFTPGESLEYQYWFIPKSRLAGLVHRLMGESERSREAYNAARILLEEEVKRRPDDHRVRSSLGIVHAGLDRKEDAIREGKLGVELFPVSKDALIGPYRVEDLAFIYTLVGEHDSALDKLEYLLSIPCDSMSVPLLRLDPRWDPLRDHPRYKELVRRHGFDPESKPQATEPLGAKPPDDSTESGG